MECAIIKKKLFLGIGGRYAYLVATALSNKGKDIFAQLVKLLTSNSNCSIPDILRRRGFIKMLSMEYPNVKGYAIF